MTNSPFVVSLNSLVNSVFIHPQKPCLTAIQPRAIRPQQFSRVSKS